MKKWPKKTEQHHGPRSNGRVQLDSTTIEVGLGSLRIITPAGEVCIATANARSMARAIEAAVDLYEFSVEISQRLYGDVNRPDSQ